MAVDKFDRLLEAMPRIAASVNAFESAEVQSSAFQALVTALSVDGAAEANPPKPRKDTSNRGVDDTNKDGAVDSSDPDVTPKKRAARKSASTKKNFTVPRGMHFAPAGKPSLEDFAAAKKPGNQNEYNLVAVYYLERIMEEVSIDVGKVLAVYKAAGWTAPKQPDNSLWTTASVKAWIDTADMKAIKLVWAGENHLESKMPKPDSARTSK